MKTFANLLASWLQILISGILLISLTLLKLYEIAYAEILLLLCVLSHTAGFILRFSGFGRQKAERAEKV